MLKSKLVKVVRDINDAKFEISKMKEIPIEALKYLRCAENDLKDIISILKSAEDFDELIIAASRLAAEEIAEDNKKELSNSDQTEDSSN